MPATRAANPIEAYPAQQQPNEDKSVRLHITPLKPDLLKVYLAPSILPLAKNISYHAVETFPEKGYGYVELPEAEAQKLRKKLNGTTLRGAKVRIEMAKSDKRKVREETDAAKDTEETERPSKRVKKDKKRKEEQGVLEGVELENDRKVKRGWTEPLSKSKKDRKDKKDKDKEAKHERKKSKYTKEPEMLFKAKLTPVAATEVARKEKKKEKKEEKKDKKEKKESRSRSKEVVVHEFEKNSKTPSFLKEPTVTAEKKPAVEYINGQGWVDEDGKVVEPETGKARNRRVLELVDMPAPEPKQPATPKEQKKTKVTPSAESESEADDSSVVSSSSEDLSSDSEQESDAESAPSTPAPIVNGSKQSKDIQATPTGEKEVHPLEALFKRPKPSPGTLNITPKKLTPINTSFSFFETNEDNVSTEPTGEIVENAPTTPFTERDLEWRGLRSAAPTPDTAAIGRRFSFDWRKGSHEADDDDDDDEMVDAEASHQLSQNTKANASKASHLPGVTEEDEDAADQADAGEEKPESEFRKWFWENRGDLNRSWKKRRRDALKSKRHTENRKMTPHRPVR